MRDVDGLLLTCVLCGLYSLSAVDLIYRTVCADIVQISSTNCCDYMQHVVDG